MPDQLGGIATTSMVAARVAPQASQRSCSRSSTRSSCGRCGWSSTSACTSSSRSRTTPRACWPTTVAEPWTPDLARAFLGENSGADIAFLDSELVRYLGIPGQAISYKLGERAWLEGRAAAQAGPGRRLRPQGVAHGGAVTGIAGPRRPRGGARAAVARGSSDDRPRPPHPRPCRAADHSGPNPAQVPGNAKDTSAEVAGAQADGEAEVPSSPRPDRGEQGERGSASAPARPGRRSGRRPSSARR